MSDTNVNSAEVLVRREGRAGRLTLNRPQALNALTAGMVHILAATLAAWAKDPGVEVVILDGAGGRALCAGGDIVSLYESRQQTLTIARTFWADEYRLNAAIHRYPKPYVALMDGFVMGGGVGLSAHARHRIVTDKTMLAMPETTIGLIPDVGGTFLLSRARGGFGAYLGLTGYRMSGSDAIQAGFADTFMPQTALPGLVAQLTDPQAGAVLDVLDRAADAYPIPLSPLMAEADLIDKLFAGASVTGIKSQLLTTTAPLAQRALADLAVRSPRALALTLEAIRRAKRYKTLEEALVVEYRLCNRLYEDGEFIEGIRAAMIDKDKKPRWNPPTIEAVTEAAVAAYFAPLPSGDLSFT